MEGEEHTGVFGSRDEDWHTRRRLLTPAFSAHKMKLVSVTVEELGVLLVYVPLPSCMLDCVTIWISLLGIFIILNSQLLRSLGICILFGT